MNLSLFIIDGYNQFIWLAFISTFLICLVLYMKTINELKKFEKEFTEKYKYNEFIKVKAARREEALSSNPIF